MTTFLNEGYIDHKECFSDMKSFVKMFTFYGMISLKKIVEKSIPISQSLTF